MITDYQQAYVLVLHEPLELFVTFYQFVAGLDLAHCTKLDYLVRMISLVEDKIGRCGI